MPAIPPALREGDDDPGDETEVFEEPVGDADSGSDVLDPRMLLSKVDEVEDVAALLDDEDDDCVTWEMSTMHYFHLLGGI